MAQVRCEYSIPFTVIRTISDQADESSSVDFKAFIKQVASRYAVEIITNLNSWLFYIVSYCTKEFV